MLTAIYGAKLAQRDRDRFDRAVGVPLQGISGVARGGGPRPPFVLAQAFVDYLAKQVHRLRHHPLCVGSVGNYTSGIVHGGIAAGDWRGYLSLSLASCGVIMRRVVIDTNVFVAAGFNPRSAAARILAAVREGRFQLIWNEPTRRETEMILRRIPHIDWERVSDLFQPETEFTGAVDPESFTLVPDPDDRKFAALSAAAQTPLVTNDHHLLSDRNIIGVDALTPRAFLAREGEDT